MPAPGVSRAGLESRGRGGGGLEQIKQRIRTGAEAGVAIGQTVHMRIKKPFERSEQIVKASSGRSSVYKFRFR